MSFLDSVQKPSPPIFTQNITYSKWRKDFEAYISFTDPDFWIPLVERYERPVIEGTQIVKPCYSMTAKDRKAYNDEQKTLTTIQESLSMEILNRVKHHNNAYDLWFYIEKCCGGYKKEEENQNTACLPQIKEVNSDPLKCLSCIQLTGSNNIYMDGITKLRSDLANLTQANQVLKENEKYYEKKYKAYQDESKEFKAKIYSQQDEIDLYLKNISLLNNELAYSKSRVIDLRRKMSKFATSSMIFDHILDKQKNDTKSKVGVTYNHVPPPMNYLPMPNKDEIKDFVPSPFKIDTNSVNASVNEQVEQAELVRPTFVKADNKPPVSVEEVVEVEDIPEESSITVEKINVKPENFIITTENDESFKCKGKTEVDNGSLKVNNVNKDFKSKSSDTSQSSVNYLKKNKLVDKSENDECSTSTSSTSGTSTSTCSPNSACSTNVPINRPSVYCPPPKRFEGTHWNRSHVDRRSCFRCGQQGHVSRDCNLLSLDRFGRVMPRTSSFRNSFSRRGTYTPVSSCASNSTKPMARVNKVVPNRPQVQQHNIVENKSSEPKLVWKPKTTNTTSMQSSEFLKYHKLMDVMIMDDSGQPKSIKAWVSHKI